MPGRKPHKIRLEDIPKENPLKAPEGYFEDFTMRLHDRIAREEAQQTETGKPWWQTARSQMALAASLLLLAVFAYGIMRFIPFERFSKNINYAEAVENNLENYDIDLLSDYYDVNATPESTPEDTAYTTAVITYLVNEDVDLGLIMEDLH
ncbi:MAG TPA: hypothetical protein VE870_08755 [Bacteroidales bacterium]|nr:hypothetical protein [Bacteroidales bacterium]